MLIEKDKPAPGERLAAAGDGWRAVEVTCDAGPADRPFEEAHEDLSVSAVLDGVFAYRSGLGRALMTPGSLLLGNPGGAYRCSHEVCRGDRCLAFQFSAELVEETVADFGGLRRPVFSRPRLPPVAERAGRLHAARRLAGGKLPGLASEALALDLLGAAFSSEEGVEPAVTSRDERRIAAVLDYMHAHHDERLGLGDLAKLVGLGRHQFLRVFRRVVGQSPHAYLIGYRLARAAVALDAGSGRVIDIALDNGFSDLSEFTRRFRDAFGRPPAAYRNKAG
ncbi:AraC family transcriptional regulator [Pleomorphomonas sp. JP5]|uniref:AraC family transcriptional regulator n=1 Tax=Pleomorphomonas sp. JP5 TaxID=2942998 RepID=UPI002044178E|nr:AraC family transcriptional regulator [Pleomorphomonas sp. JP5]MCM5556616.1 AraC family transcriptional regulator [Pleomorphomonas sp. JP5]